MKPLALFNLLLLAAALSAQTKLGESLKDIEVADHWIYDDLPRAIEEAKSTGKPLMAVLRCVPCPPGRPLDTKVMQPDGELAEVERDFICVRVIQTNSLDLNIFQYDYDMSWAAMFLNADMTVYGRYGTRNTNGPGSDAHLSPDGFRKAAERALALHKNYPENKRLLAAKTGPPAEYRHPPQIPGLTDRPARATERQNCIHCHMVKEYALRAKWEEGKLTAEDLFTYPMPERIGLSLDVKDGLTVERVAAGSPADEAGLQPGDKLVALAGQPLISTADVQWVLHHSPQDASLKAAVDRSGERLEKTIAVKGDWKEGDIAWRASSWYALRQGVKFLPLTEEDKKRRGIAPDALALEVNGLFGKGGPLVQKAGLVKGDVIVAVDGKSEAMTESEFLVYLRLAHGPEDSVKFTVLRGDARRELVVPLW